MTRFAIRLAGLNLLRLWRRLFLLVTIAAAFALLAVPLSRGAEEALSRDGLPRLRVAVTGHDGEAETLVGIAENMADISQYCSFVAAEEGEAMELLKDGAVSAVLSLPADFIDGIRYGSNDPAVVHLDSSRPVESMLTLYVGQCAADMVSASQGGIYAVLDQLEREGLMTDSSVWDVNVEYFKFMLARGNMYRQETVSATGSLPVGTHYARCLMVWLLLMCAVLFYPALSPAQGDWRARLKAAGCTPVCWALGALVPVLLCLLPLSWAVCAAFGTPTVPGVAGCALFASGFAGVVCALCRSETAASALCFVLSGGMTVLSGGVVPPGLMPKLLRGIGTHVPTALMRAAMGGAHSTPLLLWGLALLLFGGVLLGFGFRREGRR